MKKEILGRFGFLLFFLVLVSLLHWPLKFSLLFFWLGTFLGSFLLSLDHLVYVYFQVPYEFTSQRVQRFFSQRNFRQGISLLWETRGERQRLILHSVLFQVILLVLAFFVLSSSSSLFGKGLVLGLLLRSLIDQVLEFVKKGEISAWFWHFKLEISQNAQVVYLGLLILVFVFLSLFLV